jgi:hypothetical protein
MGEDMDRSTVDEGVVKITFPSGMTADSVEELEQFFNLFIRKAKRRAGAEKQNDKVKEAARQLECGEDEARWDERLRKVARQKPGKPA